MRRWEHAESSIPEGIWGDLASLCRKQSATLAKLADKLDPPDTVVVYKIQEWDNLATGGQYLTLDKMAPRARIEARRGW